MLYCFNATGNCRERVIYCSHRAPDWKNAIHHSFLLLVSKVPNDLLVPAAADWFIRGMFRFRVCIEKQQHFCTFEARVTNSDTFLPTVENVSRNSNIPISRKSYLFQ